MVCGTALTAGAGTSAGSAGSGNVEVGSAIIGAGSVRSGKPSLFCSGIGAVGI